MSVSREHTVTARRWLLAALCAGSLAAALCLPTTASAQSALARVNTLFNEAKVHFYTGKYELAADKFVAVMRIDPSLPGPYRYLGLTYQAMDKCDLALAYYHKYLQLRPTGKYADRIKKEIETCERKVGPGAAKVVVGAAQIVLRCTVEGAQVHIDGVLRGSTPTTTYPVQPGKHTITVFRSGYVPWNGHVDVVEGQAAAVEVDLKPDPKAAQTGPKTGGGPLLSHGVKRGVLKVVGLPSTADLTVGNTIVSLDDNNEVRLGVGEHRIEVTGRGLEPWASRVTIEAERTTTIMPQIKLSETARTLKLWGWIATGSAVALGLAAGAVGLMENKTYEEIRDYDRQAGTREDLNALVDKRRGQALASNILFGVAGAALATGVVLLVLAPEQEAPPRETRTALDTHTHTKTPPTQPPAARARGEGGQ